MFEEFKLNLDSQTLIDDSVKFFLKTWLESLSTSNYNNQKLLNYLLYMTERLILMKGVLKETGSIYLHCDPTASHYLKVIMDGIFGSNNFINEIIWAYRTGGASNKYFSKKHDVILMYAINDKTKFFKPIKEKAYTKSKSRKAGLVNYGSGTAEFFEDEAGVFNWVNMRDVWDIPYLNSQSNERLGYPTQKP